MANDWLSGPNSALDALTGNSGLQKAAEIRNQLSSLNSQLATIADPSQRNLIMQKIQALEGNLQSMLQKNNVMNNQGQFVSPSDIQNQYIDKSYLQGLTSRAEHTRDMELTNALRAAKQNEQKGYNTGLADIVGATEGAQSNLQNQVNTAVKQERELGYSKSAQDIMNKFNMSNTISQEDRQQLQNELYARLQIDQMNGQMTMAEMQGLQQQLADIPEGLLVQAAKLILPAVGEGLTSGISKAVSSLFNRK